MDFNYTDSYNEFIYKSKVNSIADKEVYYPTHFKVDLPKKIKIGRFQVMNFILNTIIKR